MAAGDLTTLSAVKNLMNLQGDSANDKLSDLITACSAWVKQYLNRDILQADYTEILDGTGNRAMLVTNYPVTAITQVTVDGTDITAQVFSDGRRKLMLKTPANGFANVAGYTVNCFRSDIGNVQVTYTAGYATCPADLEMVVRRMVQWAYTEVGRPQQTSKSMQGEVIAFNGAPAPQWAIQNLNNWKRVI